MLQKRKLNPNLVKHSICKQETMPVCISGSELVGIYENTDLEFTYVYAQCKRLKLLKDIDLSLQRIEAFYIEFLHMGWNKKIFDNRFNVVKRAKLYGTVFDLNTWLESEITYNESDFELEVDRRINSLIQKGERLSRMDIELTEEEKKYVQMAASKKIEYELNNRRIEVMEKAIKDLRETYIESLNEKKRRVAELLMMDKERLTDWLFEAGKVRGNKTHNGAMSLEYQATLYNLEDFADLIPEELL